MEKENRFEKFGPYVEHLGISATISLLIFAGIVIYSHIPPNALEEVIAAFSEGKPLHLSFANDPAILQPAYEAYGVNES